MAWIGFDFDGTLAEGLGGPPVPKMLERLQNFLEAGAEVRILTARAGDEDGRKFVRAWLDYYGLPELEITDKKDYDMLVLYDDRARQVIPDMGLVVGEDIPDG